MRRLLFALGVLTAFAAGNAVAQDDQSDEARTLLERAQSQYRAQQYEEAAATFRRAYESLRGAGNARAPLALWNAGQSLSFVPGREREARDTLQRFLDESDNLTNDDSVRDQRSRAVTLIGELDLRISRTAGQAISPVGPILLGIGGAAVIAGVVLGAFSLSEADQLRADCGGEICMEAVDTRFAERAAALESLSIATDVLLFGGAAIAITGLILTFVLREEAPPAAVACGPSGCGAMIEGRF